MVKRMIRGLLLGALAGSFFIGQAHAQSQVGSGYVQGNASATSGLMKASPLTDYLDRVFGSTVDKTIYRGSGGWVTTTLSTYARTLIDDADAATARATLGVVIGTNVQAWDTDLDCLAALSTTGLVARTGAGTCAVRTLTAPAAGITVTNGDGVSGNPTLVLANDLAALEALASTGIAVRTATDTWAQRTLQAPAAGFTITNPAGVAGDPTFVLANDLAAVEGLSGTGIARRTGTDAWSVGTAVSNSELATMVLNTTKCNATAGTAVPTDCTASTMRTNIGVVIGTNVQAWDADLDALAANSTAGLWAYTGAGTGSARTITGTANEITVTNGAGTAGNPTLSLPTALTFTGKTVTGGSFSSPAITTPTGIVKGDVGLGNVANVDTTVASNISSGTLPAARLPNPSASILGGVQSAAAVSNQWINSISTSGVPALSQPAFSNISGTATATQGGTGLATYAQGDLLYASATNTLAALAKSASSTRYLSNTGTSNAPAWAQVDLSNGVTGNLPVANLNSGTSASATTFWRGDGTWSTPAGAGDVVGPASAVSNNVTSFNGTTGKLIKDSGIPVAALPTAVGQLPGTATNDSASAGNLGEYLSTSALAVAITSATGTNATSRSLTAGDWDISCTIKLNAAASTSISNYAVAITSSSGSLDTTVGVANEMAFPSAITPGAGFTPTLTSPIVRASLSGTTTYYCVGYVTYATSTLTVDGFIRARRVR